MRLHPDVTRHDLHATMTVADKGTYINTTAPAIAGGAKSREGALSFTRMLGWGKIEPEDLMNLNLARTMLPVLVAAFLMTPSMALVEDPYDLLPKDNAVSGWLKQGEELYYYPRNLDQLLGSFAADIANDYGVISVLSQFYTYDMNQLEIRIYEMGTGQDAFGLYSVFSDIGSEAGEGEVVYMDPEIEPSRTVTPEMRWNGDTELELLGDYYFIQLIADKNTDKMTLLKFASKIQGKFDIIGGTLDNSRALDADNKVFGSERLIGGYHALGLYFPVGHFDPLLLEGDGARCIMAEYRITPGTVYEQIVVEYPDERSAREAYKAFGEWADDFNYVRRLNVVDSMHAVYAVNEDDFYFAGFRDGSLMRLLTGFEDIDVLKETVAGFKENEK
jgi:hypothetical protein